MADALKVSRGSFYWHFVDVGDFKRQVLESWRELATERVVQEIEENDIGSNRLGRLMHRAMTNKHELDRAVRLWAADDENVASAVASVDDRRVEFIRNILVASGVASGEAQGRARFIYWAYLGRSIATEEHEVIEATTMDGISVLLQT